MIKSITNFLIIFFIFSSLNLKYLKLTKMDITRFAMKLFIYSIFFIQGCLFSINTAFQESPVNMNIDK